MLKAKRRLPTWRELITNRIQCSATTRPHSTSMNRINRVLSQGRFYSLKNPHEEIIEPLCAP